MAIRLNYNPAGWKEWKNRQEKHKSKMQEIYKSTTSLRIDNKLPEVLRKAHSRKDHMTSVYGSSQTIREIDKKNAKILEKLTRMARTPVVLKTLPLAENKVNTRKHFLKKLENSQLYKDNLLFAQRLAKTSSSVSFRKLENDYINNQKYSRIRLKHKTAQS